MNRRHRFQLYLAVLIVPFALLLHLNSLLELERHQTTRDIELADEYRLPSSNELAAASLNYRTATADLLWVGAILYASEQRQLRQPRRAITQYANAIIDLDPYFASIYYWHHAFRYEGEIDQTFEDLEEANRILAKGLEYFPDNWILARAIAMNHLGHRFERSREERIADLQEAVHYSRMAAEAEGAPPLMTGLAISFQRRLDRVQEGLPEHAGRTEAQLTPQELDFLLRRYFAAENDEERRRFRHHLMALGAEDEIVARATAYERHLLDIRLRRYPYLMPDLHLLVDSDLRVLYESPVSISP